MLHIGEVTSGLHVILVDNVHIAMNKKKILFVLRTSKTHNPGYEPQMIRIATTEKLAKVQLKETEAVATTFCPFKALQQYIKVRAIALSTQEQFFIFRDNSPLRLDHSINNYSMYIQCTVDGQEWVSLWRP